MSHDISAEHEKCTIEGNDTNQAYKEAMIAEMPRAAPVYLWWPHRKYLKVHYTVSHTLYLMNTNHTRIVENIMILNDIVHTIYMHNLLEVHVCMLCIWNNRDSFDITQSKFSGIVDAIAHFGYWKMYVFRQYSHDTSILFTGNKVHDTQYFAHQDGICNPNRRSSYVFLASYHIFFLI